MASISNDNEFAIIICSIIGTEDAQSSMQLIRKILFHILIDYGVSFHICIFSSKFDFNGLEWKSWKSKKALILIILAYSFDKLNEKCQLANLIIINNFFYEAILIYKVSFNTFTLDITLILFLFLLKIYFYWCCLLIFIISCRHL